MKGYQYILSFVLLFDVSNHSFADDAKPALEWPFYGKDHHNTAYNKDEAKISPKNVSHLKVKWIYLTTPDGQSGPTGVPGSIVATPSFKEGVLYFPDWAGFLHAVDAKTGKAKWKKSFIDDYSNDPKMKGLQISVSRNTPAIADDKLILGGALIPNNAYEPRKSGAVLIAVSRKDGSLIWSTQLDDHPFAVVTQSPIVVDGIIYVGVSGAPESATKIFGASVGPVQVPETNDIWRCCTFRGSMLALDVSTGKIKWKTYTLQVPDPKQADIEKDWRKRPSGSQTSYSGNSVWGNTAVVDKERGSVYIATGQTHMLPNSIIPGFPSYVNFPLNQLVEGNYSTGIIALDTKDGHIKWHRSFGKTATGLDAWNACCIGPLVGTMSALSYCPNIINTHYLNRDFVMNVLFVMPFSSKRNEAIPNKNYHFEPFPLANPGLNGPLAFDQDFAQGPMLIKNIKMPDDKIRDLLIIAQKSGWARALDPDTGETIWATFEGPGGLEGHGWGGATDGKSVYLSNSNVAPSIYFTILDDKRVTKSSYWSALDVTTGKILWENPEPDLDGPKSFLNMFLGNPAGRTGPITLANGVVFAGAKDKAGTFVAMDSKTGRVLWTYSTAKNSPNGYSAINSRPAIVDGIVYWGAGCITPSGFSVDDQSHNRLYAFEIPDN